MLPEILVLYGSVQITEKGHTGFQGHVLDVYGGGFLLHKVVSEHALEHRRARRQDRLVGPQGAVGRADGDIRVDRLLEHAGEAAERALACH